jgi:biotin carboxyl carrier protein
MPTKYIYKRDSSRLFIAMSETGKNFKIYLPVQSEPIIDNVELPIQMISSCLSDYCYTWNDKRYTCILKAKDQNKYTILVNGVEYKFSIESISSYFRRKLLSKEDKATVEKNLKAPMPGKIVDIYVAEGDLINAGEPILNLEAMKMQNEFTSPVNGIVRKIYVTSGQSVMKDELLAEINSIDD